MLEVNINAAASEVMYDDYCHGNLDTLGEAFGHVRRQLVADHWTFLQSEQDGGQTLSAARQHGGLPAATLKHTEPSSTLNDSTISLNTVSYNTTRVHTQQHISGFNRVDFL